MARGINKVILVGNLGRDPEVRYSPNGSAVANVTIATSESWKDKNTGEKQERTEWHRVVFFGKLGEIAGEYLRKGSQVYVEGSIRYDKFTGQDGQERYYTDIVADEMQMLGGRPEGGGGMRSPAGGGRSAREEGAPRGGYGGSREAESGAQPPRSSAPPDEFSDDDIPF